MPLRLTDNFVCYFLLRIKNPEGSRVLMCVDVCFIAKRNIVQARLLIPIQRLHLLQ